MTDVSNRSRVQPGVPGTGRFADEAKTASDVVLDPDAVTDAASDYERRHQAARIHLASLGFDKEDVDDLMLKAEESSDGPSNDRYLLLQSNRNHGSHYVHFCDGPISAERIEENEEYQDDWRYRMRDLDSGKNYESIRHALADTADQYPTEETIDFGGKTAVLQFTKPGTLHPARARDLLERSLARGGATDFGWQNPAENTPAHVLDGVSTRRDKTLDAESLTITVGMTMDGFDRRVYVSIECPTDLSMAGGPDDD